MTSRRDFLGLLASLMAAAASPSHAAAATSAGIAPDASEPFSWQRLIDTARLLAASAYARQTQPRPDILQQIDWAAHGQIHFKPEADLFATGPGQFPIAFFHPGKFFQTPVRMYQLETTPAGETTRAYEIPFRQQDFDMPDNSPARQLGSDTHYAGFRIQESRLINSPDWRYNDWAAFLGASYFRAIGDEYQYGLSARGIAINVTTPDHAEEFPAFTRFYFSPAEENRITVYALLDGPSLTGAYRFVLTRAKDVIMEVSTELFLRQDVARLGIAPVTSMYWFSEKDKLQQTDWRPEVHDSDGLAMWTGNDEHLWRPLNNPAGIAVSSFSDHHPRGFGLMQRQRRFDAYLDDVHYERRPSLWVEPLQDWGSGTVELVELHTSEEVYDNIVAMWVPSDPAKAGQHYSLAYRLYWSAQAPVTHSLARCVGTHIGRGGEPGNRPADTFKFEIEFEGGPLDARPDDVSPAYTVSTSAGKILNSSISRVPDGKKGHWRVFFDLAPGTNNQDPAELRLTLHDDHGNLSETWLYQFNADHHS